jgi:ABC-type antimicrobial peptide transport system permease subunit
VIGVAADGKYEGLDETSRPFIFHPLDTQVGPINLIARTSGDPRLWIEPINATMRAVGQWSPFAPMTFSDIVNFSLLGERIAAGSVGVLSSLALLLAILGLFGAISYSVSERKKELGIRVALGARSWQLVQMILRQTVRVTGVGVSIGILFGVGATILVRSQLYGISTVEWTVLVPVTLFMLGVSLLVAYISARPWIAVDPMEAVRHS